MMHCLKILGTTVLIFQGLLFFVVGTTTPKEIVTNSTGVFKKLCTSGQTFKKKLIIKLKA